MTSPTSSEACEAGINPDTELPLDCPHCGDSVEIESFGWGYSVVCHNCYDGAPDAGPQLHSHSYYRSDAVVFWNDSVHEYTEAGADENAATLVPENTL